LVVNSGELHATVIDTHWNDGHIALLDASASAKRAMENRSMVYAPNRYPAIEEKTTLTARRTLVNSLKSENTSAQDVFSVSVVDFIALYVAQRYV
ncbi:MAG: hypothetical protein AAF039_05580, partial [Bacteroidota bacterium]